ncbi:hypothetical protein HMPREF0663_11502 [Hoylesella oralis ATCC 33269]|uniref:Uncharacterized protein n=1 Tax=Hoylesella oralis ATCC 33269 TaxID=873533 RepID=E7RQQ1_9BACT|nr:hypothetical protein [Hoylesella oralis]EFZ36589.1 hypothetical protein HMPREF0663_11502 [Hoylesella oralis ATCC 33269]EPH17946.1 hypothetical protein HMPREF1475_00964 [Hoylesella oralis HGA0225]SHF98703.1 hypothetical protein SAMN05444288_2081 [Hoylesella oralis]
MSKQNNFTALTWAQFKEEILHSQNMMISLDSNDIQVFEEKGESAISVIEASSDDCSDKRFKIIGETLLEQYPKLIRKEQASELILMSIQYPASAPIGMEEMMYIQELIGTITSSSRDCQIKWGMGAREDNISRIVVAAR